jgi:hypothetical protein
MARLVSPTLPPEQCEELERRIAARTGRRVHGLHVEVRNERIVLLGRTSSYYLKQLAQHCVWDVLPGASLENGIVVE